MLIKLWQETHIELFFIINKVLCNLQIFDLLGPKSEADLAPPPKTDKKGKSGDAGKKQKKEDSKGISFKYETKNVK